MEELSKWDELYLDLLANDPDFKMQIPVDLLPGETEADAAVRYFREVGILSGDGDDMLVDLDLAEELDPNYRKFFESLVRAQLNSTIDWLEDQGYIYTAVSETGEVEYVITETGQDYLGFAS